MGADSKDNKPFRLSGSLAIVLRVSEGAEWHTLFLADFLGSPVTKKSRY